MKYLTGISLRNHLLKLPCNVEWQAYDDEKQLIEQLTQADLTINAMAMDESGRLLDPANGEADISDGFLRHVGRHFADSPENLLNVAVQASELGCWGFRLAHGTHAMMKRMVLDGALSQLSSADIRMSLQQAMQCPRPSMYFKLLNGCNALGILFPQLEEVFINSAKDAGHGVIPDCVLRLDAIESTMNSNKRLKQLYSCVEDPQKFEQAFQMM